MADKIEKMDAFDLLEAASDYIMDPTDKEAEQAFSDMKAKLIIRNFLPLEQKEYASLKTLYDINALDLESQHFASALEVSLTFNALFAYIANVDYNVIDFLKDDTFYDIFWMSGLGDYILQFCEKDYERLKNMVMSMVSFENIKALLAEISDMNPDSIERLTESFNSFVVNTKPETLKAMADIMKQNDPTYNRVVDTIEENAVKAAMARQEREEKEEKEKQDSQKDDSVK